MKKILYLLLILGIIGILWLGSSFWEFSKEDYVNSQLREKSVIISEQLDLEFLKEEFKPAYEF